MAREIVTWCDPCMERDERVPGREHTVALDGTAPKVVALCDSDEAQYLKPLAALLGEFGAPVEGKAAQPAASTSGDMPRHLLDFNIGGQRRGRTPGNGERAAQCLWCPLSFSNDGSGLLQHLERVHGLPRSLREAFGPECPLCGTAFEILGGHLKKTHHYASVTEGFLAAREAGDPHGIYAKILAKAPVIVPPS